MTRTEGDQTIAGPQGDLHLRVDRAEGAGVPVLLLHSDAGRLDQYDELVAALASAGFEHPLARLDLRGHGRSAPAADEDYSFAGRADDLAATLDALGWDRVALVAHSGGNGAALTFAGAHPDRVAALLMVDPPTDPAALPEQVREQFVAELAGPGSLPYLQEYYRTIAGSDSAVVDRVLADAAATVPAARAGLGPALLTWSPDLVDGYPGPRFVVGTDVTDTPYAVWQQRPDLPHTVVHGTGHWVAVERPDAVAAVALELVGPLA